MKKNSGFTLIEILIAIAIFAIITSIAMVNFWKDQNWRELKIETAKIESIIRKAQSMALSGQTGQEPFQSFMILPSDCIENLCAGVELKGKYNASLTALDKIKLENSAIEGEDLSIEFESGRGRAVLSQGAVTSLEISIISNSDQNLKKCIEINSISGRINILNNCSQQ